MTTPSPTHEREDVGREILRRLQGWLGRAQNFEMEPQPSTERERCVMYEVREIVREVCGLKPAK